MRNIDSVMLLCCNAPAEKAIEVRDEKRCNNQCLVEYERGKDGRVRCDGIQTNAFKETVESRGNRYGMM